MNCQRLVLVLVAILWFGREVRADPPMVGYIFPAGGQRGTQVAARVAGCNLNESPKFFWSGSDVIGSPTLRRTETIWFEGPLIPQPSSQQREDYPRDYSASLVLAENVPLDLHAWRLATSQGVTAALGFVIGDFPEVVEQEEEGNSTPIAVTLPVTINGRIFPREDVDTWSFSATAGQVVTCHVATSVFGSPLDARVVMADANGRVLGETVPVGDVTPPLRLSIPATGEYHVRIHDVGFQGLQNHVYRLTVTTGPVLDAAFPLGGRRGTATRFQLMGSNLVESEMTHTLPTSGTEALLRLPKSTMSFGAVRLELDEFEEFLEAESGGSHENSNGRFTVPAVLNGRIRSPGEEDVWVFTAEKGREYDFDVHAARCDSPLDAAITLCDSSGKTIQEADDEPGLQTDARLRWTATEDGDYLLRLRDRLASRGDRRFAYRVRATSDATPDFSLKLAVDSVNLERGQSANVKVTIERGPGFKEPVELALDGLPAGVTMTSPNLIAANQQEITIALKAEKEALATTVPVRVTGTAKIAERQIKRSAVTIATSSGPDAIPVADADSALWVSVAIPTPFKFVGVFESKFIPRGAVYVRKYRIERNGFAGPLEVQLADRQGRHLQGVTARKVLVHADQNEFEFAVELPSWMEIGRTCRSTLSMSGLALDSQGNSHTICYSSNDQHNQMIALVDTGRLTVQLSKTTLTARPGARVELPIQIQRSPETAGSVKLELIVSKPIGGVSALPVTIDGDKLAGTMVLEFGTELKGLSVHPLIIRATTRDERGLPVTAEAKLTLVDPRLTAEYRSEENDREE